MTSDTHPANNTAHASMLAIERYAPNFLSCFRTVAAKGESSLPEIFRVISWVLWHLSTELGIEAPKLASLRAMYGSSRALFDHHQVACESRGSDG
jgi:hypothetical protein